MQVSRRPLTVKIDRHIEEPWTTIIMSFDPLSALANSTGVSIKLFEVTYQLKAVGDQTRDLFVTTEHIATNVEKARRLRRLKSELLSPKDRAWMDCVIAHTEDALRAIAQLIEPARIDMASRESIHFCTKIKWVFRDNPRVADKHRHLNVCHQSLSTVMSSLHARDLIIFTPELEIKHAQQPPPYDTEMERLFNWQSKKRRRSGRSLRATDSVSIKTSQWDSTTTSSPIHQPMCLGTISESDFGQSRNLEGHRGRDDDGIAKKAALEPTFPENEPSSRSKIRERKSVQKSQLPCSSSSSRPSSPAPTLPELVFDYGDTPLDWFSLDSIPENTDHFQCSTRSYSEKSIFGHAKGCTSPRLSAFTSDVPSPSVSGVLIDYTEEVPPSKEAGTDVDRKRVDLSIVSQFMPPESLTSFYAAAKDSRHSCLATGGGTDSDTGKEATSTSM